MAFGARIKSASIRIKNPRNSFFRFTELVDNEEEEVKENTQPVINTEDMKENRVSKEGKEEEKDGKGGEEEKRHNLPDCPFCQKDFR